MPREQLQQAFFTVAPDWVAEISSPSTAQRDRLIKVPARIPPFDAVPLDLTLLWSRSQR